MTGTDKVLTIQQRIFGVTALFALGAVFMPMAWMAAVHRWLGLGEMPIVPGRKGVRNRAEKVSGTDITNCLIRNIGS